MSGIQIPLYTVWDSCQKQHKLLYTSILCFAVREEEREGQRKSEREVLKERWEGGGISDRNSRPYTIYSIPPLPVVKIKLKWLSTQYRE